MSPNGNGMMQYAETCPDVAGLCCPSILGLSTTARDVRRRAGVCLINIAARQ